MIPPRGTLASVIDDYSRRLRARREALAARERAHVRMGRIRLAIAASAGLILWVGGMSALVWLLVPAAAFLASVVMHAHVLDARDRAASAVAFYERGLARLRHEWIGKGSAGDAFLPPDHPFAADLDLFGRGSLFELLATTRTRAGEARLASWLLHAAAPDEIRDRQLAVQELTPMVDLRESVAVLGDGLRVGVDAETLRAWATAPVRLGQPIVRAALLLMSTVTAVLLVWWMFADTTPIVAARTAVILLGVQSLVGVWFRWDTHGVIHAVDPASRDLELLAGLLRAMERATFTSPRLVALQQALGGHDRPASADIARLAQLVALLRSRQNAMFALPALMIMWSTQVAHAIEAWRLRVGPKIGGWLDAAGEFEALTALAAYAAEHPDAVYPDVQSSDAARLDAADLAHPLLPATAIANDVALGTDAPHLLIVSGSNMSGKSTFLRAIGINLVLAGAGAPVRATRFRCSSLTIGASIRVQDSLQDGRSRFFAEITRLKQIVDLARSRRGATLFLLDEILAGTNSHDRRHGAEALLTGLVGLGAIGLATTHDLALGDIAQRPEVRAANVHFEDAFVDGALTFDYRLRPGLVRTSNAIPLMRSIGLDV